MLGGANPELLEGPEVHIHFVKNLHLDYNRSDYQRNPTRVLWSILRIKDELKRDPASVKETGSDGESPQKTLTEK